MLFVTSSYTQTGDSFTNVTGEIQLDCYQYSRPTCSPQWYKDGIMLRDTTRITGTSTSRLSITNVIGSDFGVYQCYVGDFYSRASALAGVFHIRVYIICKSKSVNADQKVSLKFRS